MMQNEILEALSALAPESKLHLTGAAVSIAGLALLNNRERIAVLYAQKNGIALNSARIRVEVAKRVLLILADDLMDQA